METLLQQALLVTMDPGRRVERGDLLVRGDRIAAVGGEAPPCQPGAKRRVVDARGLVVLPGLVQTHVHVCQTLFRGQADDLALLEWLRERVWPLEAALDADALRLSARLGCRELLEGGTTSILDMATVQHTDSVFEAAQASGIRAWIGKAMMDEGEGVPPALLEDPEAALLEAESLADRWHGAASGRISYALAPRFVVSCSEALLEGTRELANARGLHVHTHAAENRDEVALVEERTGRRNVAYLDHLGLTGPSTLIAHGIWLDDDELEILARSGTRILHCPSSNLKLRSGVARVPEMIQRGISVSLGADGAPCNNRLDAFREMFLAATLHSVSAEGPLCAMQALEMATIEGARALGVDDQIGSLEPGKKADLIALDLDRPHTLPSEGTDPISRIVYSAGPEDVVLTMVDGAVVWERGDDDGPSGDELDAALRRVRGIAFGGGGDA